VVEGDENKAVWAQALFERAVARSALETSWQVIDAKSTTPLLRLARRSDLVILPPPTTHRGRVALEQLVLESGRPLLILPRPTAPVSIGNSVVVAWNGSRESARALHDAMPILSIAEAVCLLSVVTPKSEIPPADQGLIEHLRQYGVAVESVRRAATDVGEAIAKEVRQLGADMLVLGISADPATPRPRFGEVSKRFLRTGSLPVLVSH
jgi:nucleotide-binding universal stress UspA family protein